MKTVFTILGLLIATVSFGQANHLEGKISTPNLKLKDLSVSVTVDSAEDIESTFKMKDIKTIINEIEDNEDIAFKIICNGDKVPQGRTQSTLSYSVIGNTNDVNGFLKSVKTIRKAALKYYKNK